MSESTYVVQSGDTLRSIALALYGDADRWSEIFEANKDKLSDPNLIHAGQELRIPQVAETVVSISKPRREEV